MKSFRGGDKTLTMASQKHRKKIPVMPPLRNRLSELAIMVSTMRRNRAAGANGSKQTARWMS